MIWQTGPMIWMTQDSGDAVRDGDLVLGSTQ